MIKLIIFDLDGVLVDCRDMHYEALNKALHVITGKTISREDHLSKFDGLNTKAKLDLLNISGIQREHVFNIKQKFTLDAIDEMPEDSRLRMVLAALKDEGFILAVCSNSIRQSLKMMLVRTGLIDFIDFYLSNEDVKNPKPASEGYLTCMIKAGVSPHETLIVEDSPHGREAAKNSGAKVVPVLSPRDVTFEYIMQHTNIENKSMVWDAPDMTVLVPMAGYGSRFSQAGFTFPKPLIETIDQKPMIQLVVENLNIKSHYIFIVQKEHYEKYNLGSMLKMIAPYKVDIVIVDGVTDGAARTALLAKEYINNDKPLIIANSDQFVEYNSNNFMWSMNSDSIDGGILLFKTSHPKYSFAKIELDGFISEVAEKRVISEDGTVGIYYWKRGSDFVNMAEQMISKDIRVNNEFYICPVYQQAIEAGMKIKGFWADKMWGIGDPEGLKYFIDNYGK